MLDDKTMLKIQSEPFWWTSADNNMPQSIHNGLIYGFVRSQFSGQAAPVYILRAIVSGN